MELGYANLSIPIPVLALQIQGEKQGAVRAAASVQYRGVLGTILTMARTEGPCSLYNGLVAGLQRQMSFASIRIGLYDSVKQLYTPKGSERERPVPGDTRAWVQRPEAGLGYRGW